MIIITSIVVATDFSEPAATAFMYGRELARTFHATLHLVHVVDDIAARTAPGAMYPELLGDLPSVQRGLEEAGRASLNALLSDEDREQLHATAATVTSTDPAHAILDYAERVNADMIVAGTHGRRGVSRLFLGSVAERLVRHARCPVLTVRHPEHEFVRPDALQPTSSSKPQA